MTNHVTFLKFVTSLVQKLMILGVVSQGNDYKSVFSPNNVKIYYFRFSISVLKFKCLCSRYLELNPTCSPAGLLKQSLEWNWDVSKGLVHRRAGGSNPGTFVKLVLLDLFYPQNIKYCAMETVNSVTFKLLTMLFILQTLI